MKERLRTTLYVVSGMVAGAFVFALLCLVGVAREHTDQTLPATDATTELLLCLQPVLFVVWAARGQPYEISDYETRVALAGYALVALGAGAGYYRSRKCNAID